MTRRSRPKMNEITRIFVVKALMEADKRFNHNHGPDGKFTSGSGAASGVDKSSVNAIINKRPKSLKIGKREKTRLSHQIATEFPNLKADGKVHNYSNRNHFYRFSVNDFGSYNFHYKIKIVGNEDFIKQIRKKGL